MKLKFSKIFILCSLFIGIISCAKYDVIKDSRGREPTSITQENEYQTLLHFLALDKFKYYVNEYLIAKNSVLNENQISFLKQLEKDAGVISGVDVNLFGDAHNYDSLIFDLLVNRNLAVIEDREKLSWGYNFFKNKLNEGFSLKKVKVSKEATNTGPTNISMDISLNEVDSDSTLNYEHYISNRTTRAVFWDAEENSREILFFYGDQRDFLKNINELQGEVAFEVSPLARNYNKIYIIKSSNDNNYKYAITNIGGKDRLKHLVDQVGILKKTSGNVFRNKFKAVGDINIIQDAAKKKYLEMFKYLPKPDRVIIGQKDAIEGKFNLIWKVRALKNLYDEIGENNFEKTLNDSKIKNEIVKLIDDANLEKIFQNKKIVEDAYLLLADKLSETKIESEFKTFNYDNSVLGMSDIVFKDKNGKKVSWRIFSNTWGDEIIPLAEALKESGDINIVYIGTVGAVNKNGIKVGDLVSPEIVKGVDGKSYTLNARSKLQMRELKNGGVVEHVSTPFEESQRWLNNITTSGSDYVEIETAYLGQVFRDKSDNVEVYLLVSDILGSEDETLAHATSSKRKKSQNRLLAQLIQRDSAGGLPSSVKADSSLLKDRVFRLLSKNDLSFRYYIYSNVRSRANISDEEILEFANSKKAFTDNYLTERLLGMGRALKSIKSEDYSNLEFKIGLPVKFFNGTWGPKEGKLIVYIDFDMDNIPSEVQDKIRRFFNNNEDLKKTFSFAEFRLLEGARDPNLIWKKMTPKIDSDIFIDLYTDASMKNAGVYKGITLNGGVKFGALPILETSSNVGLTASSDSCIEVVSKIVLNN